MIGLDDNNMPMEKEAIQSKIINVHKAIFYNLNSAHDWLIKCHIDNLVEENISRRQAQQMYKKLFEQENIIRYKESKHKINKLSTQTATLYNNIESIDENQYVSLIKKNKKEGLTQDEQNKQFKYIIEKYIIEEQQKSIYNKYSSGLDYEIKQNRIQFNNIIRECTKESKDILETVKYAEFEKMTKQQLVYLKDMKDILKLKDYNIEINSDQLLSLKSFLTPEYIQQLRLVSNKNINVKEIKKAEDVKTILNNIFDSWNGSKLTFIQRKTIRKNNKKTTISIYKFNKTLDYSYIKPNVEYDLN